MVFVSSLLQRMFRKSRAAIQANFRSFFNISVKCNGANTTAEFTLPGLAYNAFTRAGVPAIWGVLRLRESTHIMAIRYNLRSYPSDIGLGTTAVISAQVIKVYPAFYKKVALNFPMTLLTYPGRLGKKSATLITRLSEASTEEVLSKTECQFVLFNIASGKTVPIPQTITDAFLDYGVKGQPSLRVPIPKRPKEVFDYDVRVAHSDTGFLYHTNHTMYTKYCMDCASFAQHAGFLRQLKEDVFSMQARELTMFYHSQTFPGDQLCVSVWQDEEDRETLHFQVHKGSESVLSSTICFHSDQSPLKAKL